MSDTFENNFSSVESCSIFSGIVPISSKILKKLEALYIKYSNSSVAFSNFKDLTSSIFLIIYQTYNNYTKINSLCQNFIYKINKIKIFS